MKKYTAIEDNGGCLYLFVFDDNDGSKCVYVAHGYEYSDGIDGSMNLADDIEALKVGEDPVREWDGRVDNPQELWDQVSADPESDVIADNNGVYPARMGSNAVGALGRLLPTDDA